MKLNLENSYRAGLIRQSESALAENRDDRLMEQFISNRSNYDDKVK
jgi:hypothetical protein